jgi:hypothetical protein
MSAPKYLIDTNVFIGLEDHAEVAPDFASLQQLAARHGVGICVHAAAIDIKRDNDAGRRRVSLSKIAKFQTVEKVMGLTEATLAAKFGVIRRHNDLVDATLLHALEIGVADFLVTEDQGLHARAHRVSATLGDRVLYVADAVSLLRTTYEDVEVALPAIREVYAHTIPQDDPIFVSLRADYPLFDGWWREKCVKAMRKCWVVLDSNHIAGLVVRKDERPGDTDATLPGQKILKVCTFKVRPESRGIKLGELLLKQVLWYAQSNRHDVVYLTTFPAQSTLIALLEYYGFDHTHDNAAGEMVYEKALPRQRLEPRAGMSLFDLARRNYPRFARQDPQMPHETNRAAVVDPFFEVVRDGQWNACVGIQGGVEDYVDGYTEAALELATAVIDKHMFASRDTLAMPILYSCRHALELALKYAIEGLFEMRAIAALHQINHDILSHWRHLRDSGIGNARLMALIVELEPFVVSLAAIDDDGQELRYAHNREGQRSLGGIAVVNLPLVRQSIERMREIILRLKERLRDLELTEFGIVRVPISTDNLLKSASSSSPPNGEGTAAETGSQR